jgi:hypothetical protein
MTMECWTELYPEQPLVGGNVPRYTDVVANGVGHYLHDPSTADAGRVVYE